MWYEKSFRRHLCDMHIDDWDSEYMSKFSPEEYYENLKRENVQSVMIYVQSHVGLCYYPTKTGKMHNAFIGKEDQMKRLIDMCRNSGIHVVAYYSVTYNNWAHDNYPDWRMITKKGTSMFATVSAEHGVFASNPIFRYGLCCPNNMDYRNFTLEQIKEFTEYFNLDGVFYDMLFWVHPCYCDKCKERFFKETGHEIPMEEDYQNPVWLLFEEKRREWMGEFAQFITRETEKFASIHSNPPGHNTDIPALLLTNYGKGKVLWMGLPIEDLRVAEQYRRIYTKLLTQLLGYTPTVKTTAPIDVEVVVFKDGDDYTVSSVLLNDRDFARFVEPFTASIKTDKKPAKLLQLPEETEVPFTYENGYLTYEVPNLKMFDMKKIVTE